MIYIISYDGEKSFLFCQKKSLVLITTEGNTLISFLLSFPNRCLFFFFLVTPIFPVSWSESVTCKMLGIFWKNPSLPEFNSITEHTTVYFDFTGPAKSASTTKWLLWITSFNSIYIHVLLLKNMEGSQRSQFKDNFQVNIE